MWASWQGGIIREVIKGKEDTSKGQASLFLLYYFCFSYNRLLMLLLVVVHSELILHNLCSSQEDAIHLDNYCDSWKKTTSQNPSDLLISVIITIYSVVFINWVQFETNYSGQYIKHKSETLTKIPLEISGSDHVLQSWWVPLLTYSFLLRLCYQTLLHI